MTRVQEPSLDPEEANRHWGLDPRALNPVCRCGHHKSQHRPGGRACRECGCLGFVLRLRCEPETAEDV